MKNIRYVLVIVYILVLGGCNLPKAGVQETQSPDAVFTQAAQTVAAELTRVSSLVTPTSNIPTSTFTPSPTNTPIPSPTKTPIPCNLATWDSATIDVTIPDNTQMTPNQIYSKTWRIRNVGACSWNSSYLLFFDHGTGMGVSAGYTQQLTSGIVNPSQEVDLTVNNLKAPASPGTYIDYWRLKGPDGVAFGITPSGGTFAVKIVVVNSTSVTLLPVIGESGSVRSDGVTSTSDFYVGDGGNDKGLQLFIAYNIAGIPANATILEVKLDMRNASILGDPFGSLGTLNLFMHDFLPLDGSDYIATMPGGNLADWGSAAVLGTVEISNELKAAFQSKVGSSRIQFRFQFPTNTDDDGVVDAIQYVLNGGALNNPALLVKYLTP
jgi:hypothetical protein